MPLLTSAIYPPTDYEIDPFSRSKRSVVHSKRGIIASSQPLATACGLEILRKAGNCADAAVAVAAGLSLTEPGMTGPGGDMFCLFYNAKTRKVHSLNGSGRAGAMCTLEAVREGLGLSDGEDGVIPLHSPHAITVPGAAAGWVDTVEKFGSGKVSLEEILEPAIRLGEEGFPVSEKLAALWQRDEDILRRASPNSSEILKKDPLAKDGVRAPRAGEIIKNPTLSNTLRLLAKYKKPGFYTGSVAEEIVKVVQDLGGYLTLEDLKHHMEKGSEETEAIKHNFKAHNVAETHGQHMSDKSRDGIDVWEHPPNGQGIVALMALGIIEELQKSGKISKFSREEHNSARYLHVVIEALRIALSDANWWVSDPNSSKVSPKDLLSPEYLSERAELFSPDKATDTFLHGSPVNNSSDTVYFAVTDSEGNGISFINSIYHHFGSGIIPRGCGFTLHNRGVSFVLQPPDHPNILAPRKRPYHTIIPAIVTNASDQSLHSVYGIVGGFMQPQGQVQILLNQLIFRMDPQAALDSPRVCVGAFLPVGGTAEDTVYLEDGISIDSMEELKHLGHKVEMAKGEGRCFFGTGQVIRFHVDAVENEGVWSAGSDQRGDGAAVPFI